MNVDMLGLYSAHGVPHWTRGKNCQPGWVQVRCPHCDDKSNHLGWNMKDAYFNCWKCGTHRTVETLALILEVGEHEAFEIANVYKMRPSKLAVEDEPVVERPSSVVVPGGPLGSRHRKYLVDRRYDPDELTRLWGVTGTDIFGPFAFRVIYPIWHDGVVVSYQGRDITGQSDKRWKTCPQVLEVRDHKHSLGGSQLARGESCVVVEGATDGWRLGPGAVWTFGTTYLLEQVELLLRWRRIFIMHDSEEKDPQAPANAERLAYMLAGLGREAVIASPDSGDPGDLSNNEARYLMEREWRIR